MADRLDRLEPALMDALTEAIRRAARPLPDDARRSAQRLLPARGGLGAVVSHTDMPVVLRARGRRSSVLIAARSNAVKDPGRIDRGRIRHPVFGRWVEPPGAAFKGVLQDVNPGWFRIPMRSAAPEIRREIVRAIHETLDRF